MEGKVNGGSTAKTATQVEGETIENIDKLLIENLITITNKSK